jgi:hypothetical protein
VGHQLTVCARDFYAEEASDEARRKLRAFNELQHSVSGQTTKMLSGDEARYPDEVLISILFDKARDGDCESQLSYAFEQSWLAVTSRGTG